MLSNKRPHHTSREPEVRVSRLALGGVVLTVSIRQMARQVREDRPMVNRVPLLRREHGLSREELASQLQIHPTTLVALERGRYQPSLPLASRISEVFGLPIEAIFFAPATPPLA